MDFSKTFIQGLDGHFEKNFEPGTCILVESNSSNGEQLMLELFYKSLSNNEQCAFITTKESIEQVKKKAKIFGKNFEEFEKARSVRWIDAFSKEFDSALDRTSLVEKTYSLKELTDLSIAVSNALNRNFRGKNQKLFFNSISSLLEHNSEERVLKFLSFETAKIRKKKAIGIFAVNPALHSAKALQSIRRLMDIVLEVHSFNGRTFLKISEKEALQDKIVELKIEGNEFKAGEHAMLV